MRAIKLPPLGGHAHDTHDSIVGRVITEEGTSLNDDRLRCEGRGGQQSGPMRDRRSILNK
jgi:hypothetical protein